MKNFYIVLCWFCAVSIMAQRDMPAWVERAKRAVFTIEAYDSNGNVRQGNGFFIQGSGEAVSDYTLFNGAVKAVVTDADGRKLQVNNIIGADEIYDVIRFKVAVPRNVSFLSVASVPPAKGAEVFLISAKEPAQKGGIEEITKIKDSYDYYKVNIPSTSMQISLPLLTSDGEVFALSQADASGRNKTYGVSVQYIQGLRFTSIDLLSKKYASIGIRSGWSDKLEEAQVSLILYASQQDAPAYLETLNDFIETFPNVPDGYLNRASHYLRHRKTLASSQAEQTQILAKATDDLNRYLKINPSEDDGLYNHAKLIYEVLLDDNTLDSKDWNIRIASEKLQRAIAKNDIPVYRQLEGDIAFFQGDFEKAYESYMTVNQSPYSTSLSFFMASNALQRMEGGNMIEVIALMDRAVAKSLAVPSEAAAYLQESIDLKMQFGMFDAAIIDYNRLYIALSGNVTDVFYYYREQAKFRAGDLDGAMNDIETAIALDPQNAVYYAEEASIYLRKQDPAKAIESVNKSLAIDPEFAASHRLLGVCLLRLEKKDEACRAFQKAKELGDPIVDRLIADNCK